jgi:hypothetical protein
MALGASHKRGSKARGFRGVGLSRLPAVLEQKISTGQYHKAAVGNCDSGNPAQGFTTYKVAVMLY